MNALPMIHVVGEDSSVKENTQYTLWVGKKDNEIVCLALSRYVDVMTQAQLLLEVDAEFAKSTVVVDVYIDPQYQDVGVIAKFWSTKYGFAYGEQELDPFLNDDTEQRWKEILNVGSVSFYPWGGPSDKPERYPDFHKQNINNGGE